MEFDDRDPARGLRTLGFHAIVAALLLGCVTWTGCFWIHPASRLNVGFTVAGLALVFGVFWLVWSICTGRIVTIDTAERTITIEGRGLTPARRHVNRYPLQRCEWRLYRMDVRVRRSHREPEVRHHWLLTLSAPDQAVAIAVCNDEREIRSLCAELSEIATIPFIETNSLVTWNVIPDPECSAVQ